MTGAQAYRQQEGKAAGSEGVAADKAPALAAVHPGAVQCGMHGDTAHLSGQAPGPCGR